MNRFTPTINKVNDSINFDQYISSLFAAYDLIAMIIQTFLVYFSLKCYKIYFITFIALWGIPWDNKFAFLKIIDCFAWLFFNLSVQVDPILTSWCHLALWPSMAMAAFNIQQMPSLCPSIYLRGPVNATEGRGAPRFAKRVKIHLGPQHNPPRVRSCTASHSCKTIRRRSPCETKQHSLVFVLSAFACYRTFLSQRVFNCETLFGIWQPAPNTRTHARGFFGITAMAKVELVY